MMVSSKVVRSRCCRLQTGLIIILLISCLLVYRNYFTIVIVHPNSILENGQTGQIPLNYFIDTDQVIQQKISVSEENWKNVSKSRHELLGNLSRTIKADVIWEFFNATFDCPFDVERVGKTQTKPRGNLMCGLKVFEITKYRCTAFSYGVKDGTEFELEILRRTNCEVYVFDPKTQEQNVPVAMNYPENAHFVDIALGAGSSEETLSTLKSAMKSYKVEFVDILKIDVNGIEYEVMHSFLEDFPKGLPIGQIIMEIHVGPAWGMYSRAKFQKWWESLEAAGLRAFSKECKEPMVGQQIYSCQVSFLNVKVDHRILHGQI